VGKKKKGDGAFHPSFENIEGRNTTPEYKRKSEDEEEIERKVLLPDFEGRGGYLGSRVFSLNSEV